MGDSLFLRIALSAADNDLKEIAVLTPKPTSAVKNSRLD